MAAARMPDTLEAAVQDTLATYLAAGGTPLKLKEAKALPSSD